MPMGPRCKVSCIVVSNELESGARPSGREGETHHLVVELLKMSILSVYDASHAFVTGESPSVSRMYTVRIPVPVVRCDGSVTVVWSQPDARVRIDPSQSDVTVRALHM